MAESRLVIPFAEISADDDALVGGKNASLGEMIATLGSAGVRVPDGFATTAHAYRRFLDERDLTARVEQQLGRLHDGAPLHEVGAGIREMIIDADLPPALERAIADAYRDLGARIGHEEPDVAVRSSATAEDLPGASFAGQQETFLNVTGVDDLLDASKRCIASLYTDRAISYRRDRGFDHTKAALSVGVQHMVRSDLASAGVMFTIDTESGFPGVIRIDASWGLGEAVVGGEVDPDAYVVFKPLLTDASLSPIISRRTGSKATKVVYAEGDGARTTTVETSDDERMASVLTGDEILRLARWAVAIERHYGTAMDIEWAKDGRDQALFVVQARPETVHAGREAAPLRAYRLTEPGKPLVAGLSIGDAIAAGRACVLADAGEIDRFEDGCVLVTGMTDPDWEPVMKRAAAIVTDHGGRTSHAAIVSRELGVPAIVGTGEATTVLEHGRDITVSCAEGDKGVVYQGTLAFEEHDIDVGAIPDTGTEVMLNLADPGAAFRWWRLPADGVGLARIEFIVNNHVRAHPMALLHPERLDERTRGEIDELTRGYDDKGAFFVDTLAYGIARVAASRHPDPVIVRMSDFKTNEYAGLLGGAAFEPAEENPMLGWRGASRYYSEGYRDGFALECRAVRRVREEMGLDNVVVMIPFCRTVAEADRVLEVMASQGLVRGERGLAVYVMAEVPSNILRADELAERFDGFSIGSNDLTQLTLGVSRESERLADLFDERDPAVTISIERLIEVAHHHRRKVGLCGQRPSDDPEFARFLVHAGIDSVSVSPDSFLRVKENVARAEEGGGT